MKNDSIDVEYNVSGIQGLHIIIPKKFEDNRGFFQEIYCKEKYEKIGILNNFVQDNESVSKKGVLRGLHVQRNHPQAKLIRVLYGEIYDVAIDLRKDSDTYGKWYGVILSDKNNKEFYIPEGFAHGFYVLSDIAKVNFKVSNYWYPGDEVGIRWNDPMFDIEWPIENIDEIIISDRDAKYNNYNEE